MPDTREKLIELLENVEGESGFRLLGYHDVRRIADHLVASDFFNELQNEAYNLGVDSALHNHFGLSWDDAAELRKEVKRLQDATRWIPVTERLPESQKTVLISAMDKTFGYRHTLMAAHIGHHEAKTEDYGWQEYEGDTEYDEEADCFWIPECWWESNFVEDNTNWVIDSDYEVTHWMPLPEPPKGD